MDWNLAVERNGQALKRVLATLVAMMGLSLGDAARPAHLPRRLHRAVLRLLRPAESAARRLVIIAARGLAPAVAPRLPDHRVSTGQTARPLASRPSPRPLAFPLFDPLRMPVRRRPRACGVPRISVPGWTTPFPIRRSPTPDDPIDAARLFARLDALAVALDNLPRQAQRFTRWQASRDAERAQKKGFSDAERAQGKENPDAEPARGSRGRRLFRRLVALRPGRPPGACRRGRDEVHAILDELHNLVWMLERERSCPDTS